MTEDLGGLAENFGETTTLEDGREMRRRMNGAKTRLVGGLAVTVALLVPLAVLGGPALARSTAAASEYGHSSASQYQYKVQVCHKTHSRKHPWVLINISSAAVPAHLRHGDTLVTLTAPCPPPTTGPQAPSNHGNGHGHNAGDKGKGHGK